METRNFLKTENIEDDENRIWRLITMQGAESLLNKNRKVNKKYTLFDGIIKRYLE